MIPFGNGSTTLGQGRTQTIQELAQRVAEAVALNMRAGAMVHQVRITGYGDDAPTAQGRATAVEGVFRARLETALRELTGRDGLSRSIRIDMAAGSSSDGQATIEIAVPPYTEAVRVLASLSGNAAFDIKELTRGILHLGPDAQVSEEQRRQLFELVESATAEPVRAAGWASSLAALSAYHLASTGVLNPERHIRATDGSYQGLNLTAGQVGPVDTSEFYQRRGGEFQGPLDPLWSEAAGAYVVVAKGGHDHVMLPWGQGELRVSSQELVELLARDPGLLGGGADKPVLLVWPGSGDQGLEMPRKIAFRAGKDEVWGHSGTVGLVHDPTTGLNRIVVENLRSSAGQPLGGWFVGHSDDLGPDGEVEEGWVTALDGTVIPDSEIKVRTIDEEGRSIGRATMSDADLVLNEPMFARLGEIKEFTQFDPASDKSFGDPESLLKIDGPVYHWYLHGVPLRGVVERTEGRSSKQVDGPETGRFIKRRPSMKKLGKKAVVDLGACWADAPAEDLPYLSDSAPAPYVFDPLGIVSYAQGVANGSEAAGVLATDRPNALFRNRTTVKRGTIADPSGTKGVRRLLRQEPKPGELAELAVWAGLHNGSGPVAQETLDTTMRLVRALRRTFLVGIEDSKADPDGEYRQLLRGLGALENMRAADKHLPVTGPFSLNHLHLVVHARYQRTSNEAPKPGEIKNVLLDAAKRADEAAAGTVSLHRYVQMPSLDWALKRLNGENLAQLAADVLRLPNAQAATRGDVTKLVWGTVKGAEALRSVDDPVALAKKALHLPAAGPDPTPDEARNTLLWLMAGAAVSGFDPSHPTELAAFDLVRNGALDDTTRVLTSRGVPTGRNWTGNPVNGPVGAQRYVVSPNGTLAGGVPFDPAWRQMEPGSPADAFVVLADSTNGHVSMPWPDGSRRWIPGSEIAALLRHDRDGHTLLLRTPLLMVGSHTNPGGLAQHVAHREGTARTTTLAELPGGLVFDPDRGENVIVLAGDPAQQADHWQTREPAALADTSNEQGTLHTFPGQAPAAAPPSSAAPVAGESDDDSDSDSDSDSEDDGQGDATAGVDVAGLNIADEDSDEDSDSDDDSTSGIFAGASDPMLSPGTLLAGPSSARQGRNWTGKSVKRVLPGRVRVIETRPGVLAKIASEEDASWPDETYVVAADGDPGGLRVPDGRVLDTAVLAEVLAADPELAKLPKHVPLLLAVPYAQRTLDLQLLANLLGRPVVGPSGEGRLVGDGSGNAHLPVLVDRDEKKPIGLWAPYEPLAETLPFEDREWTSLDGTTFRDSDVDSRPLASWNHGRFGRLSVPGEEQRGFEGRFTSFLDMRRLVHTIPAGSDDQDGDTEELTPQSAVYVFAAHGKPGRMTLALRDGRKVWLGKQDAARYIAGLREVRQLPAGHRMGLEVCFSAADGDPQQDHPATMPPPHIDDPWDDVPFGQHAANESRMETTSATSVTGLTHVYRVLFAAADGTKGRRVTFLPEPLEHELDALARDAGLHQGPGAVPAETRTTALRLVRGLRDLFGNDVEKDRGVPGGRYERLVQGIGALETMRANDPDLSGVTPLRKDMVSFYAQQHSGRTADAAAYESLLDFARDRVVADPDAELSTEVPAPALRVTLAELATSGETVLRTVQGLPAGAKPTPRQVASTLWATVRAAKMLFNEIPPVEREAHGRAVLHLDDTERWDLPKQKTLWALTAKALAEGLDITDPDLLAAYHLKQTGAFSPVGLLWQGQNVQGIDWSDARPSNGVNWRSVDQMTPGPGGATTQQVVPEWVGPGLPDPILNLVEVDEDGDIVLHLPGRAPLPVSDDEFLALLDLDPALRTTPLGTPVLFLTSGPGALRPELVRRFAQRTGRPAFSYSAPLTLTAADPTAPLTIVAELDPATQAPGHWTKATRQPPKPSGQSSAPTGSDGTDPLLSSETVMAGPSSARQGRNWTGDPVRRVRPGRVAVLETRPGVPAKTVSEEDASWPDETYVVAADGDPGGLRVPDGRVLDTAVLAEVLAADPELAKLPKHVPVLLVVPFAERTLDLQLLANLLGRPVVGPSGEGRLVGDGSGNAHLPVLVDRDEKKPIGLWAPYEPLAETLPFEDREWTSLDGITFRDSDVDSRPLVSEDHERFGRTSAPDNEGLRASERQFKSYLDMRRLVHTVPVGSGDQDVEIEEITPDPAVYVYAAHAQPGWISLALRDGRKVRLGKQDAARYITGLREVRQLPKGHRIGLEICYSAADGDLRRNHPRTRPPNHVDDPWGEVTFGQYTANESRRETLAATGRTGLTNSLRVLFTAADGTKGRRVTFLPEPLEHELDALARDAGLHQGPGAASPDVRATTLRLVRGLRDLFGNDVEKDRGVPGGRYERLVQGIGALETMRANDPDLSGVTPLRRDMVSFYAQQHSGRTADTAAYESLLDFARDRLVADPDAELSTEVPAPALRVTLAELAMSGEAVLRTVQGLPAGAKPTPRQVASTLWATVRAAKMLFNEIPPVEREAHGRAVLHLAGTDSWDLPKQKGLWVLTARALAEGLDVTDRDLLAASRLKDFAFVKANLLKQGQVTQGVNWSGQPAPEGINWRSVDQMTPGPGGATTQQVVPEWVGPGLPDPILNLIHVNQAGNVVLYLPGAPPIEMSDDEFLALMSLEPMTRTRPLGTPVLFLTSGPGALRPELVRRFAQRTGRPAFSYSAPLTLTAADPTAPLTIVAGLDPATQAPGQWTEATRKVPKLSGESSGPVSVFAPETSRQAGTGLDAYGYDSYGDFDSDVDSDIDNAGDAATASQPAGTPGSLGTPPVPPLSDDAKLAVGRRFSALMRDIGHPVVLAGGARGRVRFDNPRPLGSLEFQLPADVARFADLINEAIAERFPGVHRHALRVGADGRTLSGVVQGAEIIISTAPQASTGTARTIENEGFLVPDVTESLAETAYTLALATDEQQRARDLFDLLWALSQAPSDDALPADRLEALRGDAYRAARPSGAAPDLTVRLSELLDSVARNPEARSAIERTWLSLGAEQADVRWLNDELTTLADALRATDTVASDPVRRLASRLADLPKDSRDRELAELSPGERERLASDPVLADALRTALSAPDFAETAAQLMVQVPAGVDQPVSARQEVRKQIARMLRDPDVTAKLLKDGARVIVVPRSEAMTSLDPFRDLAGVTRQDGRSWDEVRGIGLRTAGVTEENLLGESTSVPGAQPSYADGYSTTLHEFAHTIHQYGLSEEQQQLIHDVWQETKDEYGALWPDGSLYGMDGEGRLTDANYSSRDEREFYAQLSNVYFRANRGTDPYTGETRQNGGPDWVRRHFPGLFPLMEQLYGEIPDSTDQVRDNPVEATQARNEIGKVPDSTDPVPVNPVEATQAQNEIYEGFRALWDQAEGVHVPQPHDSAPVSAPAAQGNRPPQAAEFDDPDRPAFRYRESRRDPAAATLTTLADLAGLPAYAEHRTTRALRWVRVLRETHGEDIDTSPGRVVEFHNLIRGFGALERLRMNTPWNPYTGPLTWRSLERIVGDYAQGQGWDRSLTANALEHLLYQAQVGGLPPQSVVVAAPAAPPVSQATTVAPHTQGPPTGELSEYLRSYGTQFDGHIGLVIHEPTPDPVLEGLYRQIIGALGADPDSAEGQELRSQLSGALNAEEVELNRPYLRSRQGHRITVRHRGRDRSVDVRLAYADAVKSAKYGQNGDQRPPTMPDIQVENRASGGQSSSDAEGSGNVRTGSLPWTAVYPTDGSGAPRWWDGTVNLSATHNQLAQSITVSETFSVTSKRQAEDPAHPIDVDGRWQVQVDTLREDPAGAWQPEQSHGALTIWVHEHLAFDGAGTTDLPEPGDVDDVLPLWGADSVAEPRRLLTELLRDDTFRDLHDLPDDSERALENFLHEEMLRGTPQLQRDGGVFSPTLLDDDGNAIGMLELTARIEPGEPMRKSPDGMATLETWLTHSSSVDRSAKLTSGLGIEGSGGPTFTTDHAAGHPRAAASFGGNLLGKAGVNWQTNEGLNTAESATLMQGLRTRRSHVLTAGRVTYDVTLHRAGGGRVTGTFGPWDDGLRLRIAQRATMEGHPPGPDEVREPPEHLENLDSIGYGETPLKVDGADAMFARAEATLREEGFLPPAGRRRRSVPFRLDEPLVLAQLENLRRLRQMRSRLGLATSVPDGVDGGEPVWFERPNAVTGTRRVQLRFSVTRDTARPSVHTRRLPDVHHVGFSSHEASGGRQRGTALSGAAGVGGGFGVPLADGDWTLTPAPDYTGTGQLTDTANSGDSVGYDQFVLATANGSELFRIPARLALDLYESDADDPRIRFADGDEGTDGDGATGTTAATDGTPLRAPGATPHTVPGDVTVLVPHYRTRPPNRDLVPAGPRPGHVIREPVTDGGAADDYRRLDMVDAQGRPLPGLSRLPRGGTVDTFRGTAAVMEALGQIVAGTYPGHPEQGPVGRAVRRASVTLTGLATETARRGSAVKESLPEALTGAVNRVSTAVNWAATPVTWAAKTSVDGAVATYKWTSVAVAGASLNDQGTLATEARHYAIRPAQLISHASQILGGVHVVEGLTLPGMAADQTMVLEIRGYLTNPRLLGSESLYSEQDVTAGDTAGRQRGVGLTRQGNFQLTAVQAAPTPPDRLVHQANPSVRYGQSRRADDTSLVSSTTKVTHAAEEMGDKLWIGNDLTLLMTVKWGVRNVAGNAVGLGSFAPVTVAIDLPRGVTYLAPAQSVARLAAWFQGMGGIPDLTLPRPSVPLPARFARSRQLGKANVLSVIQLDGTTNRRERRDRLGRELTALVENEAPGSLQPGHASYLSGVEAEIARLTGPGGLRALPGRGPGGFASFHFLHVAYGGARLVEVTLRAEPMMQTPALRGVLGRPAAEGSGLEQVDAHIAQAMSTSSAVTKTRQLTANPISRYPRPGSVGRTDREGPSSVLTSARTRTSRNDKATEDRFWTRSGRAADFDLDYRYTASVRSQLVWTWPPNIPGGIFQGGLLNLSGLEGDVAQRVRTWVGRLLRGRPESLVTVLAATEVRFIGSEAVEPRPHAAPRPPALLTRDPLLLSARDAQAQGTVPFPAGTHLVPTGPTPVQDTNAAPQLLRALHEVAPRSAASWGLPANASTEAVAVRLGELIQAGEITLDPSRTAAGLSATVPGSWPLQSPDSAPSLGITLHNPRPVTDAGDVAVDRVRRQIRTFSTTSSAGSSFALNHQGTYSLKSGNFQLLGLTFPLAAQQPHTHTSGGNASASSFTSLRTGTSAEPTDRRGTRSYEVLVDTVITVNGLEGTRYVTGSSTVRLWERDVLGFGVTPPRPGPRIYDLPAMLADQDAGDLRDWARHPVTDLPGVLADGIDEQDGSAELWLALGPDPDGSRLARALVVASGTAVLSGKPVELVVRTDQGLRHWPFAADGSLADTTETTQDSWQRIRDAVRTYLHAVRAEAAAHHREAVLARRAARCAAGPGVHRPYRGHRHHRARGRRPGPHRGRPDRRGRPDGARRGPGPDRRDGGGHRAAGRGRA